MASAADPALALAGVSAAYGQRLVLHGVDLGVSSGEIVAVLGHNGAGKTTALRIMAGLERPTAGQVLLGGSPVNGHGAEWVARAGVALVPEGAQGIFPNLTVQENLRVALGRRDPLEDAIVQRLSRSFGDVLVERRDQLAGSMSGGQRQMLALAIALVRRPAVLLLDEPSTGLAPRVTERIFATVAELAAETDMAVVVVEQDLHSALGIATRVSVVQSGRIAGSFSAADCPPPTELWQLF